MADLNFCISDNIEYFYGTLGVTVPSWQLFLAMNPVGFSYRGLSNAAYEVLNGTNGDTNEFIRRTAQALAVERTPILDAIDDEASWRESHLLMVDDYFVPYHPSYQKNHYDRFVVLVTTGQLAATVYDLKLQEVERGALEQAAGERFVLGIPKEEILESMTERLFESYSGKERLTCENATTELEKFVKDCRDNMVHWGPAEFDSLYFFINKLGGPTAIRKALCNALSELVASKMSDNADLSSKVALSKTLSYEWDIVGSLFFKSARNRKEQVLARIERRLDSLLALESQL